MKGDPEVIKALQAGLVAEAHLNIQCRNYQHEIKFRGLKKVAKRIRVMADDAHCFEKKVTDRILLLGGGIAFQMPPIMDEDATLTELFQNLLVLQNAILQPYEEAIQVSMKALDDASRNLFEHLIKWHEDENNIAYLEQQLNLIKSIGESEYIAEQL